MRRRSQNSPWTTAGAAARPATMTARRSWTVRPAPPPASGTAHASSSGTSCSSACTRRGRARNSSGSMRVEPARLRSCRIQTVAVLEQLQRLLHVIWLFDEPLRIPLFTRHTEEVATVDVDGAGQTPDRVCHGMNDVVAQGEGVAFAQRFRARGLDSATSLTREPAPQDVVLAARVDRDDGPHLVIVGHDGHPWPPDDVEDRDIRRAMERLDLGATWLSERRQNGPGIFDRPGHDFTYRLLPRPATCSGAAVCFEPVQIKHRHALLLLARNARHRLRREALSASTAPAWRPPFGLRGTALRPSNGDVRLHRLGCENRKAKDGRVLGAGLLPWAAEASLSE